MSAKPAGASNKIDGLTLLVGDKEIGVPSFDDKDGVAAENEENLTPRVISPKHRAGLKPGCVANEALL